MKKERVLVERVLCVSPCLAKTILGAIMLSLVRFLVREVGGFELSGRDARLGLPCCDPSEMAVVSCDGVMLVMEG